jgi:invasion protein IalB
MPALPWWQVARGRARVARDSAKLVPIATAEGLNMGIFRQSLLSRAGSILATAAVTLALILGLVGAAAAQGVVKSVHGDWQIRCDTPPGAQTDQCALIQSVTAEDRPNVGLSVIVLKTADQKTRLLRVLAPLGVLLPSGLGLKIDQTDIGRAGFVRCLPNGCVAEVVMDDNLIKQLRTGQSATFIIFQTPEEGIGIPLGLKGFGEGYDKLP